MTEDYIKIPEEFEKEVTKEDFVEYMKSSNSDIPIEQVEPYCCDDYLGEILNG